MRRLFAAHGLALTEEQEEKLLAFGAFLRAENEKINLTSVTDPAETAVKHFLDSALGAAAFPAHARVAEIGSGGGFPSIPLMILRPDLRFTLIEATGKKCAFLRAAAGKFALPAEVVCGRAEELARREEFREKFDAATARAVARMNTLAEYCLPFVRTGGVFVAYKGDAAEELREAAHAIGVLGGEIGEVREFEAEGAGKRSIVLVRKVSPTPAGYPRGRGKERTKPL